MRFQDEYHGGLDVTHLLLPRLRITHASLLTAFFNCAAPQVPQLGAERFFVCLKSLTLLRLLVSNDPVWFLFCRSVLHEIASICTFLRLCVGCLGNAQLAAAAVVLKPRECAAKQTQSLALQM